MRAIAVSILISGMMIASNLEKDDAKVSDIMAKLVLVLIILDIFLIVSGL
jgi:hypothetical protein